MLALPELTELQVLLTQAVELRVEATLPRELALPPPSPPAPTLALLLRVWLTETVLQGLPLAETSGLVAETLALPCRGEGVAAPALALEELQALMQALALPLSAEALLLTVPLTLLLLLLVKVALPLLLPLGLPLALGHGLTVQLPVALALVLPRPPLMLPLAETLGLSALPVALMQVLPEREAVVLRLPLRVLLTVRLPPPPPSGGPRLPLAAWLLLPLLLLLPQVVAL